MQSPLPKHIDEPAVVATIDPAKDVDGFHPINVAKLAMDDPTGFIPCTPRGCMRLLQESGVETAGANAVVVGRSMIVGKPMALLLMRRGKAGDATVTVAHSRSRDLAAITRAADIVIAAIGRAHFLGADHIGDNAVVIDVGINRMEDPSSPKRLSHRRRRRLRRRGGAMRRDHPGARRSGPDDHRNAAVQHDDRL